MEYISGMWSQALYFGTGVASDWYVMRYRVSNYSVNMTCWSLVKYYTHYAALKQTLSIIMQVIEMKFDMET